MLLQVAVLWLAAADQDGAPLLDQSGHAWRPPQDPSEHREDLNVGREAQEGPRCHGDNPNPVHQWEPAAGGHRRVGGLLLPLHRAVWRGGPGRWRGGDSRGLRV